MQMAGKKSHIKKIIIVTEKESAKFTKNQKMNKSYCPYFTNVKTSVALSCESQHFLQSNAINTLQETLLCNGNNNPMPVPGAMNHPDIASGIHWETSQCLLTTTRCFTDSLLFNWKELTRLSVWYCSEIRGSRRLIKVKTHMSTAMLNYQPPAGVLSLTFDPPWSLWVNPLRSDELYMQHSKIFQVHETNQHLDMFRWVTCNKSCWALHVTIIQHGNVPLAGMN